MDRKIINSGFFKIIKFTAFLGCIIVLHSANANTDPQTILQIRNETDNNYRIYINDKRIPAGKASRVKNLDISNKWIKYTTDNDTIGQMDINVMKDNLVQLQLSLSLTTSNEIIAGTISGGLSALTPPNRTLDIVSFDYRDKTPNILIHLKLKGTDLADSELEITGVN